MEKSALVPWNGICDDGLLYQVQSWLEFLLLVWDVSSHLGLVLKLPITACGAAASRALIFQHALTHHRKPLTFVYRLLELLRDDSKVPHYWIQDKWNGNQTHSWWIGAKPEFEGFLSTRPELVKELEMSVSGAIPSTPRIPLGMRTESQMNVQPRMTRMVSYMNNEPLAVSKRSAMNFSPMIKMDPDLEARLGIKREPVEVPKIPIKQEPTKVLGYSIKQEYRIKQEPASAASSVSSLEQVHEEYVEEYRMTFGKHTYKKLRDLPDQYFQNYLIPQKHKLHDFCPKLPGALDLHLAAHPELVDKYNASRGR